MSERLINVFVSLITALAVVLIVVYAQDAQRDREMAKWLSPIQDTLDEHGLIVKAMQLADQNLREEMATTNVRLKVLESRPVPQAVVAATRPPKRPTPVFRPSIYLGKQ
jgi:hypothetical protein